MNKKTTLLIFLFGVASALHANSFELGAGVMGSTAFVKGVKDTVIPFPMVSLEYKGFYFRGIELGYSTEVLPNATVSAFVRARIEGFSEKDSDFLKSMQRRHGGADGGAAVSVVDEGVGTLKVDLRTDITCTNKGFEAQAEYSKNYPVKKAVFIPFVSASYRSQNLNNYFYGVRSVERRAGREFYKAKGGVDYTAGGRIMYEISTKTYMFAEVGYRHFSKAIADSPLVKNDGEGHVMTFMAYRF